MRWRGAAPPYFPSASHTARDRMAISEVYPNEVFISNFKGAADREELRRRGITHIASVGEEFVGVDSSDDGFLHWSHDITDDDHQGEAMAGALRDAAAFIDGGIQGGGKVLVHCAAGISRSACVTLGWMVLCRDLDLLSAFSRVFKARPCIWPNEGFMAALRELEVEERGGAPTISAAEYERWGDYEGPEEEEEEKQRSGGAGAGMPPPPFMPRLKRDETCVEAEALELAALDEASEERRQKAEAEANAMLASFPTWMRNLNVDEDETAGETEAAAPPSPARKPRRLSLSRAQRKQQASEHAAEARESLKSQSSSSSRSDASASGRTSFGSALGGGRLAGAIHRVSLMLRVSKAVFGFPSSAVKDGEQSKQDVEGKATRGKAEKKAKKKKRVSPE